MTAEEEAKAKENSGVNQQAAPVPVTMEALQTLLAPVLKAQGDLPGMVKRLVGEAIESTTKRQGEEAARKAQEDAARKAQEGESESQKALRELADMKQRTVSYENELKKLKSDNLNDKKQTELLKVIGDRKIIPSVRNLVIQDIANQVQVDEKTGAMTIIVDQKLDATGEVIRKAVPLNEGVEFYFKAHNDVVLTQAQGGAGAQGSSGASTIAANTDYDELMKYPQRVAAYIQEHGSAALAQLRRASEAKRRDARLARR